MTRIIAPSSDRHASSERCVAVASTRIASGAASCPTATDVSAAEVRTATAPTATSPVSTSARRLSAPPWTTRTSGRSALGAGPDDVVVGTRELRDRRPQVLEHEDHPERRHHHEQEDDHRQRLGAAGDELGVASAVQDRELDPLRLRNVVHPLLAMDEGD